jgi:hypothetical protein
LVSRITHLKEEYQVSVRTADNAVTLLT